MSLPFDPRVTPLRDDLAAASLRGKVQAPRYAEGRAMQVIEASAPLRRAPRPDAPLETEALFGETVTAYDESEGWAWVQLARDGYVGYLPGVALGSLRAPPTHRVAALRTHVYPGPSIKLPPVMALSLGARVAIRRFRRRFRRRRGRLLPMGAPSRRGRRRASRISSRSPSFISTRPISGAGVRQRGSTVRGLSSRR